MKIVLSFFVGLIISACSAAAYPDDNALSRPPVVKSIYWSDGDSGWINGRSTGFAFRLSNIDAPETYKPKCDYERKLGYDAKLFIRNLTKNGHLKISRIYYQDRYERHVIDLTVNGKDVATLGLSSGHYRSWKHVNKKAVEKRPQWCS